MKNLFTHHEFKIPEKKFTLWFFSDMHYGTSSFDEDRFKWFLKKAADSENPYYFGVGDYSDFAAMGDMKKIKHADLHETTEERIDHMVQSDNAKIAEMCKQMRGRLIGMIGGNHQYTLSSGKQSDVDLCERLQTTYLGWLSIVKISFKRRDGDYNSLLIFACHGQGGGKLLGTSINKVDDMTQIVNNADIYCVSEDTEILTKDGWKKHSDIKTGDDIYSFNATENIIEDDKIENIYAYRHKGDMVSIKNQNTDQLLHPEHRVYYKHKKGYLVETAQYLSRINAQIKLPLSAVNYNQINFFNENFISLCGWIVSEGHFKGGDNDLGSGILIYQKKEKNVKIIRALLDELDYDYSEKKRDDGCTVFYIKSESALMIREYLNNKKRLPEWVYTINKDQFDVFLKSFVLGDGCVTGKNSYSIYSAEKDLMDDFQAALVIHGYRSRLYFKKGGFKNGGWVINLCNKMTVDLNTKNIIKHEVYDGVIWCPTTRNKTFIARRNGMTFITGNCQGHDHKRSATPKTVLNIFDNGGSFLLKQKRQYLVRSGSFQKSYEKDSSGFAQGRLMRPADLGAVQMNISSHRDRKDGLDRTILDIEAVI